MDEVDYHYSMGPTAVGAQGARAASEGADVLNPDGHLVKSELNQKEKDPFRKRKKAAKLGKFDIREQPDQG